MRAARRTDISWPFNRVGADPGATLPHSRRADLMGSASDAFVDKACLFDVVRLIDVLEIDDYRACHDLFEARQIERAELLPFGDNDQRVGAGGSGIGAVAIGHIR